MTDLEKAQKRLEDFLEEHPEMKQKQHELEAKLSMLSTSEKLQFFRVEIARNLDLLHKNIEEIEKELKGLK